MRYAGQWFDCVTKVIHGFQWILWPRKKTRWHAYKRCNKKKTATKPAADYRRARRNLYFGGTKRKLTIVQQSWIIVRCPWSFGRHKINVSLWNTCTDWGIVIRWATSFGWRYRIVYIGKQRLQRSISMIALKSVASATFYVMQGRMTVSVLCCLFN